MNKVTRFISAVSALMAISVSCAKQELPVSTFKMDSATVIVSAGGGIYSVPYQSSSSENETSVEAISTQNWVNGFDYSVDGVISFNVDPNETSKDRQTIITVLYGDETFAFPVNQYKSTQVLASELENITLTATECAFDRENTIFRMVNPDAQSEFYTDEYGREYITAGEFASQYASEYSIANPDDLQTADDFLSFVYTDPTLDNNMTGTFYDVYFYTEGGKKKMSVNDGSYAPGGNAELIRLGGEYTYDEETGTIYLYDTSNAFPENWRNVEMKIEKSGRYYIFQVTKTKWPDYWEDYFSEINKKLGINLLTQDRFGFVLGNYSGTEYYVPFGTLIYTLKVRDSE